MQIVKDEVGPNERCRATLGVVDAAVKADMGWRERGLGKLVVEGNRLRGWRLISGQHLQVVQSVFVADDEFADSGAPKVVHFLEACLVEDTSPFFTSGDSKS